MSLFHKSLVPRSCRKGGGVALIGRSDERECLMFEVDTLSVWPAERRVDGNSPDRWVAFGPCTIFEKGPRDCGHVFWGRSDSRSET
jgi:hypothetical protein